MKIMKTLSFMNANVVLKFLLFGFVFCCQNLRAGELDHKLPVLTGKVTYATGSFFGYGMLHPGDTMKLDLAALDSTANQITFEKGKSSAGIPYIPLPTSLRMDWIKQDAKAQVLSARLIAGSKNHDGTERIIIDIERFGAEGTMSIIQERGIVESFARLDCKFSMP